MTPRRWITVGLVVLVGVFGLRMAAGRLLFGNGSSADLIEGPAVLEAEPIAAFRPSEPDRRRFGSLEFLGGLVLKGVTPGFGSLSALHTFDSGRQLLGVGDEATWFAARLVTDPHGALLGIADARLARLRDERGGLFEEKMDGDAESIAVSHDGERIDVLVGLEGWHRVVRHHSDHGVDGLFASPEISLPGLPGDLATLRRNGGLEAIALAPAASPLAGALLLVAEDPRRGERHNPAWLVGGPTPGLLHFAVTDGFAVTDAAFLPEGDLLLLERRLGLTGFSMRLERVPAAAIRPDRTVTEAEPLLTAAPSDEIDNMEGLAVDTAPDGATILTLVSDDNNFRLQRTVLLRFRLASPIDPPSTTPGKSTAN